MMDIRDMILHAGLKLFNQQGCHKVTVRHIAAEIGISHGNLCYHFPRKEDIILALFHKLSDELTTLIRLDLPENIDIRTAFQIVVQSFSIIDRYKFLMIDLVSITRKIPQIKGIFPKLVEQRKEECALQFSFLAQLGYIKNDVPPRYIDIFVKQLFLFSNFWISEAEILYDGNDAQKTIEYAKLAMSLMLPYFTEKGKAEYDSLLDELDNN